jgi:hypothetical protein
MGVSPYKERFSLAWLAPPDASPGADPASSSDRPAPAAPAAANPLPPGLETVMSSIGDQVLSKLRAMPSQTSTLLNLASASSLRLEALLPITQFLVGMGLIERVQEDPTGNDTYKVTSAGSSPQVLLQ